MARYAAPIDGTIGMEIYNRYASYCVQATVIPDPYVFWRVVLVGEDKYPISRSGFTHWLHRLQIPAGPGEPPYIWRDPKTGAWRLKDVDIRGI